MTPGTRPAGSRRERPAKPALTRAGIVAAALAVMRAEGLDRVTMRRLAAELDTGAASLYVYVRNTAELHAAMLEELLGQIDLSPVTAAGDWRERLIAGPHVVHGHPVRASGPGPVGAGDPAERAGLLRPGRRDPGAARRRRDPRPRLLGDGPAAARRDRDRRRARHPGAGDRRRRRGGRARGRAARRARRPFPHIAAIGAPSSCPAPAGSTGGSGC